MKLDYERIMIFYLALSMVLAGSVRANPSLDLGFASGNPCEQVTISITLTNEPGVEVSATSNDIGYDSTYLTPKEAVIGPAGEEAGKSVADNVVEPGLYRVGVLSMSNLSPIPDGIIAYLTFEISCDAPIGIYELSNSPSCSSPQGDPIDTDGSGGSIEVTTNSITSSTTTTSGVITTTSTAIIPITTTTTVPGCISDEDCDDVLFCNGAETCNEGVCQPGSNPCEEGEECDEEGDLCKEPPLPCDISIAAESAEVVSGGTLIFSISTTGDCASPDYQWLVESDIGSVCDQSGNYSAGTNNDFFNQVTDLVKVVDNTSGSEASATVTVSWGCFLFTIYGENPETIEALRNFRDEVLSQTPEGQEIISLYYQLSPVIVKAMEGDESFRGEIKDLIDEILPLIGGRKVTVPELVEEL